MIITIETKDLLSVAEAAERLGKPRLTIYRWITSEKLKAVKLGGVLYVLTSEIERIEGGRYAED